MAIDRTSSLEALGDIEPGGNGDLGRVVEMGIKMYF